MIEVLLEAERALSHGLVDRAEQLYRQVAERDPRSSIALVGLARVALERDDALAAYLHARKAQTIDPENPAASHLVMRMAEVLAGRGEQVPGADEPAASLETSPAQGDTPAPTGAAEVPTERPAEPPRSGYQPPTTSRPRPGFIGRLLGRRRR